MLKISICLLCFSAFVTVYAGLPAFIKGKTSKENPERQIFNQVFSTLGFYLSPEDIFDKLTKLQGTYSSNEKNKASADEKRLVSDLIDLTKLDTCEKENFDMFDRYIGLQKNHVNVLSFIKEYKKKLIDKCDDEKEREFLQAVQDTRIGMSSDLVSLRSQIYYGNNGFEEKTPYYKRSSLIEGIVSLMTRKNDQFAQKIEQKQPLSIVEFNEEYERIVKPVCKGIRDSYLALKHTYGELIKRRGYIKEPFRDFRNFWKVNVEICSDILDQTKNIPFSCYHEIKSNEKGLLSSLLNLNPFRS